MTPRSRGKVVRPRTFVPIIYAYIAYLMSDVCLRERLIFEKIINEIPWTEQEA
jgi:hypothetical protein